MFNKIFKKGLDNQSVLVYYCTITIIQYGGERLSAWKFDNSKPIFLQICERIKADVASGRYAGGEKFPSVRDFALEVGVNPNTVQRAMAELEAEGILVSKRGDGRYVSTEAELASKLTDGMAGEACRRFVDSLRAMGLGDEDITELVRRELEKKY